MLRAMAFLALLLLLQGSAWAAEDPYAAARDAGDEGAALHGGESRRPTVSAPATPARAGVGTARAVVAMPAA